MVGAELPPDYAEKMRAGTAGLCTNLPVLHNSVFPLWKCGFLPFGLFVRDTNIVENCFFSFFIRRLTDVNSYVYRILNIPLSKTLVLGLYN